MKTYPPRSERRRAETIRLPCFHAVPGRARRDGWTPLRQAEFIGHLAETGTVGEAARRVGMARETAYRLRSRCWSESLCAAWDAALGQRSPAAPRKVTVQELRWRVDGGLWQVRIYAGRFVAAVQKADNSALLSLLARLGPPDRGSWAA